MNDFEKGFTSSFIGYLLGAWIDGTRFGYWLNNSPTMDTVWFMGKVFLGTLAAIFILIYLGFVIAAFLA